MDFTPLTPRGLERRIKRRLTSQRQSYAVVTTPGFEPITAREIAALTTGAEVRIDRGIVEFDGPFDLIYRLNLHLRTAGRVLLRIASFRVRSYPELFNKLKRISWELYTGFVPELSFVVSSRISRIHHTDKIAQTAFDAVNDYMGRLGVVKTIVPLAPLTVHIRFFNDVCTVSIDTTGVLLYKRGYRTATAGAPLRETTAAAMLYCAEWEQFPVIADPCCGSGSLIIEAMHLASGKPPGGGRSFAFESWPSFNRQQWQRLQTAAETKTGDRKFFAGDSSGQALDALRFNLSLPGGPGERFALVVHQGDCREFNRNGEHGAHGLVISNLPFGKRVGTDGGTGALYRDLGSTLKKNCAGWSFAFLVADPRFERISGLPGSTVLEFCNGGIKVRLVTGRIPL